MSLIRDNIKCVLISQNINPAYIDKEYHLYYDETNNIKKFSIKDDGNTNVPTDTIFVLGGIEGDGDIAFEELKRRLDLQDSVTEVKSRHIYKGNFVDCMKSSKLEAFLDLVLERGWHLHFQSLNLLYWSIVDILDSIEGFADQYDHQINILKALFYDVSTLNCKEVISAMLKYSYPDLKDAANVHGFYQELIRIVSDGAQYNNLHYAIYMIELVRWLKKGSNQNSALFIQDEEDLKLLNELSDFYREEIYTWMNSKLVMDNESDVISAIDKYSIQLDGVTLNNFKFVDSKDCTMIQLSDVAVGIISKYLFFINQEGQNIPNVVKHFNDQQRKTFIKLNKLLKISREYNPVFFHQITSVKLNGLFNIYIDEYCQ